MKVSSIKRNPFYYLMLAGMMSLFLASCQKDSIKPPASSAKLKEYKEGDEFIRFSYNPDGSIQKATVKTDINTSGDIVDFTVTYNTQKKIQEVNTTSGQKIVPEYENGVMSRANIFEAGERIGFTNYYYETDLLKRVTIYAGSGVDYAPVLEFNFTYNTDGNLTRMEAFMASGTPNLMIRQGHVDFQVDQKTNPLFIHRDFLALLWQGVSKNNITREEHFDASFALEDVYSYSYTYKANGLPEKATVTQGLPGQTPVISDVNFSYE